MNVELVPTNFRKLSSLIERLNLSRRSIIIRTCSKYVIQTTLDDHSGSSKSMATTKYVQLFGNTARDHDDTLNGRFAWVFICASLCVSYILPSPNGQRGKIFRIILSCTSHQFSLNSSTSFCCKQRSCQQKKHTSNSLILKSNHVQCLQLQSLRCFAICHQKSQ